MQWTGNKRANRHDDLNTSPAEPGCNKASNRCSRILHKCRDIRVMFVEVSVVALHQTYASAVAAFRCGHVFSVDTGTSVGEIMGQTKSLNAVDMRPQRPFRIATASEDNSVAFFHGPPFKFQFTIKVSGRSGDRQWGLVRDIRRPAFGISFFLAGCDIGRVVKGVRYLDHVKAMECRRSRGRTPAGALYSRMSF